MKLLKSWVESANSPTADFPLNNLPCGVFSHRGSDRSCGVAIGDMILDITGMERAGLISFGSARMFDQPSWNAFMALGPDAWARLRRILFGYLGADASSVALVEPHLVPQSGATLYLPFTVAEYTDFYAGRQHAVNVGTMFRGVENALPPNWLHMPIGYNGRASTVVVSGTAIRRPMGQIKTGDASTPQFAATRRLDMELELGAVVGQPSAMGTRISVDRADEMIFGYILLNDWSARDIQAWEYQPLGPFQAKAFATSISPWIVTRAALEAFRVPTPDRDVPLLPHIADTRPMLYDISLSAALCPQGGEATVICRTNARELYYSAAQQLAHHASSGCAMRVGDLLGSGTISGIEKGSFGSLLELSWGGAVPLSLAGGQTRSFIEDGDTLSLQGHAQGDGYRIGFGRCEGRILPASGDTD